MHVIVVLAKPFLSTIKQMVVRTGIDLKSSMQMMTLCPNKAETLIGTFEFFASNPDYQDPAANLAGRICPSSPITIDPALRPSIPTGEPKHEPETTVAVPTIRDGSRFSAKSTASHGDSLHSFALMIMVCGMLHL